jgi:hypothetical protein
MFTRRGQIIESEDVDEARVEYAVASVMAHR